MSQSYIKSLYHYLYPRSIGQRNFSVYHFIMYCVRYAGIAGCTCMLGGCYHQGVIDNTVEWIHKMQGGAIAIQRPPPPGQYESYPVMGPFPTQPRGLLSPQARTLLTQKLLRDHALTDRTIAVSSSLTPNIPPLPGTPTSQTPVFTGAEKGGKDSAKTMPIKSSIKTPVKTLPRVNNSSVSTAQEKSNDGSKIHLPVVRDAKEGPLFAQHPPKIPQAPPPLPQIAGVALPLETETEHFQSTNYDLSAIPGTFFHFLPDSDQLSQGQDGLLNRLVHKTPHGPFYIRGFGHALSLDARQQAGAVKLGVLRAIRLARALIARGVPASEIHIRGDAFGTGARVAIKPNGTS